MNSNNNTLLRRVIVDFKKLTPEILELILKKFPDGYGDDDIITFRNSNYDLIEAIEIIHKDTKYLVKISSKLDKVIEQYEEHESEKLDDQLLEDIKESIDETMSSNDNEE